MILPWWSGSATDHRWIYVPDILKAAVTEADRYEPRIHDDYEEWAQHYGTAILPARVRAPDDKAKVESAVRLVEQHILAPLRDRAFFFLAELNATIADRLAALNAKPFTKREGNRATALIEERAHLKPLPDKEYSYGRWKRAKAHVDYRIEVYKRFYSLPYTLIGKTVDVRIGEKLVEIYYKARSKILRLQTRRVSRPQEQER